MRAQPINRNMTKGWEVGKRKGTLEEQEVAADFERKENRIEIFFRKNRKLFKISLLEEKQSEEIVELPRWQLIQSEPLEALQERSQPFQISFFDFGIRRIADYYSKILSSEINEG